MYKIPKYGIYVYRAHKPERGRKMRISGKVTLVILAGSLALGLSACSGSKSKERRVVDFSKASTWAGTGCAIGGALLGMHLTEGKSLVEKAFATAAGAAGGGLACTLGGRYFERRFDGD